MGQPRKVGSESGVNKRDTLRRPRRLMVRYGEERADRTAFTKNISEKGLFVQTNGVSRPGTTLMLEIDLPDGTIALWGRVAWAKKVPPQLASVVQCGMGIRIIDPPEEWVEAYRRWSA